MPKIEEYERVPNKVRREAVFSLVRRNAAGITATDLAEQQEMGYSWALKFLREMYQDGVLDRDREGTHHRYYLKGKSPQLSLDLAEEKEEAQREAKRTYNREYHRQFRAKGKVKGRTGRPLMQRGRTLQDSARLAEAAAILFPQGITELGEGFFAWVDLTRELMNNG